MNSRQLTGLPLSKRRWRHSARPPFSIIILHPTPSAAASGSGTRCRRRSIHAGPATPRTAGSHPPPRTAAAAPPAPSPAGTQGLLPERVPLRLPQPLPQTQVPRLHPAQRLLSGASPGPPLGAAEAPAAPAPPASAEEGDFLRNRNRNLISLFGPFPVPLFDSFSNSFLVLF